MSQLPEPPRPEPTLRVVRLVAPVATFAMAALVVLGLLTAPAGAVDALLGNVWGRVTIADLYLALLGMWIWITWRERTVAAAGVWGVLLLTTGSIAAWGYIALRARRARDMQELLLGRHDIVV